MKKFFITVLIMTLICSILPACGTSQSENTVTEQSSSATDIDPSEAEAEAEDDLKSVSEDGAEEVSEAVSEEAPEKTSEAVSEDMPEASSEDSTAENTSDHLKFTASALDGKEYTEEDFTNAKVILVNLWEPWCGPCRAEMPYLEKLYETYADQGLVVLGIYSTTDMDEDVQAIQDELQITYPLLQGGDQFYQYMTTYVPTTWFFGGDGTLLSDEPDIGAHEYEYWEEVIQQYLDS